MTKMHRYSFGVNRIIEILLVFLFVTNVAEGLFAPVLSVYVLGEISGATLKTIGFSVAIYSVVKSVVQVPLARLIDQHGNEIESFRIMMIGALLGVVYSLGFLVIDTVPALYLLSAVGGLSGAFLMASYYSLFAKHTDKGAEGFEWSLYSVGGLTISSALGAAVGGVLADAVGFESLFVVASVLGTIAVVVLFFLGPHLSPTRSRARSASS